MAIPQAPSKHLYLCQNNSWTRQKDRALDYGTSIIDLIPETSGRPVLSKPQIESMKINAIKQKQKLLKHNLKIYSHQKEHINNKLS